jgi:cell division septal protein FtsQ
LRIKPKRFGLTFFLLALLGGLIYVLGWSSLVTIQGIEITGTNQGNLISAQLLAGKSNLILGEPLARMNPKHEENLITDLEWVQSAQVSRNWWNREVTVSVTPKIPIAIFKFAGAATSRPRYLASDGSDFLSPQSFTNLATVSLLNKSKNLIARLTNLEVTEKGEILMATDLRKPAFKINWGSSNSPEEIIVKSNVLKGLLELRENKKITFVDLTFANAPIVR